MAAETAKVIENIQRDINIALINEILLICKKLKKNCNNVYGYVPFVVNKIRKKYRIYNKINANKKYDVILFLSNHEKFKNILLSKNRNNILDPFRYFSWFNLN